MQAVYSNRTEENRTRLRSCRKAVKSAISKAKNSWIEEQCKLLNNSVQHGTEDLWELLGKLKSGLDRSQSVNVTKMKKPGGSLCETPEENAEVFRAHFEALYSSIPNTDESVLDHVKPISIPANDA